jgi:hypothetical protein
LVAFALALVGACAAPAAEATPEQQLVDAVCQTNLDLASIGGEDDLSLFAVPPLENPNEVAGYRELGRVGRDSCADLRVLGRPAELPDLPELTGVIWPRTIPHWLFVAHGEQEGWVYADCQLRAACIVLWGDWRVVHGSGWEGPGPIEDRLASIPPGFDEGEYLAAARWVAALPIVEPNRLSAGEGLADLRFASSEPNTRPGDVCYGAGGVVGPQWTVVIENRGSGAAPDVIEVAVDGDIQSIRKWRGLEPGERTSRNFAAGTTITLDPRRQISQVSADTGRELELGPLAPLECR